MHKIYDAICDLKPILHVILEHEYPAHKLYANYSEFDDINLVELQVRPLPRALASVGVADASRGVAWQDAMASAAKMLNAALDFDINVIHDDATRVATDYEEDMEEPEPWTHYTPGGLSQGSIEQLALYHHTEPVEHAD